MTISEVERQGVLNCIFSGSRFDGRPLESHRNSVFEFSTEKRGQVLLSLGNTRYIFFDSSLNLKF